MTSWLVSLNWSIELRGDVLELGEENPRLRPFAVLAEFDVADHGRETVAVHIGGERYLIEAFGAFDRLGKHLARRISRAAGRTGPNGSMPAP